MIKNEWVNTFHKTKGLSTLTEQTLKDTELMYQGGYINSKDKDYIKVQRLLSKLCPHYKGMGHCSCAEAIIQIK